MKNEEIKKVFEDSINCLKNNFNHIGRGRKDIQRDVRSRMDETLLIYSRLFKLTFNEAKKIFNVDNIYLEEEDECK